MNSVNHSIDEYYDVIVVGAGSAGIGVSILLQKLGISYVILEKTSIGASFNKWPKETRYCVCCKLVYFWMHVHRDG